MTTDQDIRSAAIAEIDYWIAKAAKGEIGAAEIMLRFYRKPGEQVESSGKRVAAQLDKVAKE